MTAAPPIEPARPWHREPMLWLVIAIPLATAIAAAASFTLIVRHADRVETETVPVAADGRAR